MNNYLIVILSSLLFSGCQTLGKMAMLDPHARDHQVEVQVLETSKPLIQKVDISHGSFWKASHLEVKGVFQKKFRAGSLGPVVHAKFLDADGKMVMEKNSRILFQRVSGHGSLRRYKGSFLIKVPDHWMIKTCEIKIGG